MRSYRFPGLATNGGGTTCGPGIGDDGADSAEYRKDADPDQELECAIAFLTIKSENQEHRTLYQRGQLAGYNLVRIFLTRSDGDAQSEEELVGETGASHFETVKLLPTSDEMRIVFKLPGPASIYQDLDWSYLRNSFTLKRDKDSADRERYPLSPEILSGGLIDLGTFIPIQ